MRYRRIRRRVSKRFDEGKKVRRRFLTSMNFIYPWKRGDINLTVKELNNAA